MANIAETERKAVGMADGILAAVNENGNIDRFIDTKGGVHYIEPKRYEESVAKIDAAATKAKETVNSATEAVSECKAQTGACTQETARAKEIADTVESRITGIEGDVAALRDSVSRMKIAIGEAHIYGCDVTLDVSYIPAIQSLVFDTKGSGYMTTGTETGNSFKALTLPSDYRPANERCVCICANLQLKFGVALRVQTNGDVMFDISSSEPMRGFGWPSAMGFIPL